MHVPSLPSPLSLFPARSRRTLGTLITSAAGAVVARRMLQKSRTQEAVLAPALDAEVKDLPLLEGVSRYYVRPGTGKPVVLLPDLHLAATAMDVKPLFDALAARTRRPLFVPDWLGFGLSDRPDRRYVPGVYQRQLSHLLEEASEAADLVAFGIASAYAAAVAVALPHRVRKMVFVAPSGFSAHHENSLVRRVLAGVTGGTGAYKLYFARQRSPEMLAHYFRTHLFYTDAPVPEELFNYAQLSAQMPGADHAPRWLAQGILDMHEYAGRAYSSLKAPTLLILPALPDDVARAYDQVPQLVKANPNLHVDQLVTGLMPQWEQPAALADRVETWIGSPTAGKRKK